MEALGLPSSHSPVNTQDYLYTQNVKLHTHTIEGEADHKDKMN